MIIVSITLLAVALVLIYAGVRGRRVGNDPHCRACAFNLRGRNESSGKCPECGAELSGGAIQIGVRHRRFVPLIIGIMLTLLAGVIAFEKVRSADFSRWKPVAWLLRDLANSSDRAAMQLARNELIRRLDGANYPQHKVDIIADRVLALQADLSRPWDTQLGDVFQAAAVRGRLDKARIERYMKQAVTVTLTARPRARRRPAAPYFGLSVRGDRVGEKRTDLHASWTASPLMIRDVQVIIGDLLDHPGTRIGGSGTGFGGSMGPWNVENLSDGKHTVRGTLRMTLAMSEPVAGGPVTYDIPISAPIELFPPDAVIDDFSTHDSYRAAMRAAIGGARVVTKHTTPDVDLKVGALPMPLAVDIVLKQGSKEQKVTAALIKSERSPRWIRFRGNARPQLSGTVDIHLRPSQDAADKEGRPTSFWGEVIVIPGVVIDAPYKPPFLEDESLRAEIEKGLARTRIVRKGYNLSVTLDAGSPPVKLAYDVTLERDGRQYKIDSCWTILRNSSGQRPAYGCDDIDPAHTATECDVVFRPSTDWEVSSITQDPPWGGEVRLRVKIESGEPSP